MSCNILKLLKYRVCNTQLLQQQLLLLPQPQTKSNKINSQQSLFQPLLPIGITFWSQPQPQLLS